MCVYSLYFIFHFKAILFNSNLRQPLNCKGEKKNDLDTVMFLNFISYPLKME